MELLGILSLFPFYGLFMLTKVAYFFLTVWMKTKCSASQAHEYFRLFKIKLNISRRTEEKHLKKKKDKV